MQFHTAEIEGLLCERGRKGSGIFELDGYSVKIKLGNIISSKNRHFENQNYPVIMMLNEMVEIVEFRTG